MVKNWIFGPFLVKTRIFDFCVKLPRYWLDLPSPLGYNKPIHFSSDSEEEFNELGSIEASSSLGEAMLLARLSSDNKKSLVSLDTIRSVRAKALSSKKFSGRTCFKNIIAGRIRKFGTIVNEKHFSNHKSWTKRDRPAAIRCP